MRENIEPSAFKYGESQLMRKMCNNSSYQCLQKKYLSKCINVTKKLFLRMEKIFSKKKKAIYSLLHQKKKTVIQFRKIIYNRINKIIIAYCTKKVINFKTKKDK